MPQFTEWRSGWDPRFAVANAAFRRLAELMLGSKGKGGSVLVGAGRVVDECLMRDATHRQHGSMPSATTKSPMSDRCVAAFCGWSPQTLVVAGPAERQRTCGGHSASALRPHPFGSPVRGLMPVRDET
jgi:hypothetical protein